MSPAEAIIRYMQAHGLTFVRLSDTTFGSDTDDVKHANAIDDLLERNNGRGRDAMADVAWSPAHGVRQ